jgi:hypothetical protein
MATNAPIGAPSRARALPRAASIKPRAMPLPRVGPKRGGVARATLNGLSNNRCSAGLRL